MVVVAAIVVVAASIVLPTQNGGEGFFSPDSLDFRSGSTSTLLGVPTSWPRHNVYRHEFTQFLIEEGYWSPRTTTNPRWILLFRWSGQQRDGQTALQSHLFWQSEKWIEWTKQNPDRAFVLWPRVLDLLRTDAERSSLEVVELLYAAKNARTQDEFDAAIALEFNH